MARIEKQIEVNVPVKVAYNQWTQFEDFPKFMEGVEEVRQIDDTHLHWRVKVGGKAKEFDAEINEQVPIHNVDGYDYTHTNDRLWRKNRQANSGSTCIGTDINRNYPYRYGGEGASTNPCSETYRGARSLSTPEASAELGFLQTNLTSQGYKIAAYFDIHSYGAYYLSAWGWSTTVNPPDYSTLEATMRGSCNAIRAVNGRQYTYGASGRTLYITSGTTVDTLYGTFQVPNSYTIECFGSSFTPPTSYIEPIGREVWAGVKWVALNP
jgi:hypothetical protein